ncbi:hypothetical protein NQ314_011794 [Rhamnusium bicolor]|uniref:Uncharacterized protein n=1 Tax=Rhamnusium bicolor TaxID=1586634 RepID=A0AAV8XGF7_9CUCU|nr:hypothetical protein NQ314_011794 [Rhamnusium bicolor]
MQYESAIKLNTSEIQQLKSELVKKVEAYKMEVVSTTKKLTENKELTKEIVQQLHEAYKVINKLKMELDCHDTLNSQFKFEIEQSQNELEDYRIREMDWCNQKEKLENDIKEMENVLEMKYKVNDLKEQISQLQDKNEFENLEDYKNKVTEYEKKFIDMENISEKCNEHTDKYEELLHKFKQLEIENLENKNKVIKLSEKLEDRDHSKERYNKQEELEEQRSLRERLDQTEAEKDALLGRVECLETELKEVSMKYADLVNMDLEIKIRSQLKSMEKLKKENSDLKKYLRKTKVYPEDKENIGSPNRLLEFQ